MELNGTELYLIEKAIKGRIRTIDKLIPFRDEVLNKTYRKEKKSYNNLLNKLKQ